LSELGKEEKRREGIVLLIVYFSLDNFRDRKRGKGRGEGANTSSSRSKVTKKKEKRKKRRGWLPFHFALFSTFPSFFRSLEKKVKGEKEKGEKEEASAKNPPKNLDSLCSSATCA